MSKEKFKSHHLFSTCWGENSDVTGKTGNTWHVRGGHLCLISIDDDSQLTELHATAA